MTDKKLTAKLSDGTEWRVHEAYETSSPDCRAVTLFRIKPEPPKEIWANIYADANGFCYTDKAVADKWSAERRIGGKAHHYVLAPEPEPEKKPREWWAVYDADLCASRMFKSEKAAKTYRLNDVVHRGHPFLVREVEE